MMMTDCSSFQGSTTSSSSDVLTLTTASSWCAIPTTQSRLRVLRLVRPHARRILLAPDCHPSYGFTVRGGQEFGTGFFVSNVERNSEADLKGLRPGDQIVCMNGFRVDDAVHKEFIQFVSHQDRLTLKVRAVGMVPIKEKGNDQISWNVIKRSSLCSSTPSESSYKSIVDRSVENRSKDINIVLTVAPRTKLGLGICKGPEWKPGIFVQFTKEKSVARDAGLRPGDQILSVNSIDFADVLFSEAVAVMKSSNKLDMIVRTAAACELFPGESSGYNSSASSVTGDQSPCWGDAKSKRLTAVREESPATNSSNPLNDSSHYAISQQSSMEKNPIYSRTRSSNGNACSEMNKTIIKLSENGTSINNTYVANTELMSMTEQPKFPKIKNTKRNQQEPAQATLASSCSASNFTVPTPPPPPNGKTSFGSDVDARKYHTMDGMKMNTNAQKSTNRSPKLQLESTTVKVDIHQNSTAMDQPKSMQQYPLQYHHQQQTIKRIGKKLPDNNSNLSRTTTTVSSSVSKSPPKAPSMGAINNYLIGSSSSQTAGNNNNYNSNNNNKNSMSATSSSHAGGGSILSSAITEELKKRKNKQQQQQSQSQSQSQSQHQLRSLNGVIATEATTALPENNYSHKVKNNHSHYDDVQQQQQHYHQQQQQQRQQYQSKSESSQSTYTPIRNGVGGATSTPADDQHSALMDEFKRAHQRMMRLKTESNDCERKERQEALKRTTIMEDDVNHRATTPRNLLHTQAVKTDSTSTDETRNSTGKHSNRANDATQNGQQLNIPPPPPQFANFNSTLPVSHKQHHRNKQNHNHQKEQQCTRDVNDGKASIDSAKPSSPVPDYDNIQMRSSATGKISDNNYMNKNINTYSYHGGNAPTNGISTIRNATDGNRRTLGLGTVTIGEYDASNHRKEPEKFDFIEVHKRHDQNDCSNSSSPEMLRSELQTTLSRSNLKKTNGAHLEHQSSCQHNYAVTNNEYQNGGYLNAKTATNRNGSSGGGILKNGNRNTISGNYSKTTEKTIKFGN